MRAPGTALLLTVLVPATALAGSGGPDPFGYTWIDSNEAGGPTFDPNAQPVSATIGLCSDEWYTVNLGFTFTFYGQDYSRVAMSGNGALYLTNGTLNSGNGGDASNACPGAAGSHPRIAALWDDWFANDDYLFCGGGLWSITPVVGWSTQGSAPNRVFVLSWVDNPSVPCGGLATFTAKLFEADDRIEVHVQDSQVGGACSAGGSATVGIMDSSSLSGSALTVACNTPTVPSGYAVRFVAPPPDTGCVDADGDTWEDVACGGTDCDDGDPAVHPFALEICGGVDEDCDGAVSLAEEDNDSDGLTPCDGDCDDGDPAVNPSAVEACNGVDDDCDAQIDEGFDPDGDGWSACSTPADCWEGDADTFPGAAEAEDGVDNDCDGAVDEGTDRVDDDGDGYSEDAGDCDDADPDRAPGLPEVEDGIDQDCDGEVDEGTAAFDDDGDGFSEDAGDCDDTSSATSPDAPDLPGNGVDDDCDGLVDGQAGPVDADGDGFTVAGGDCDDGDDDVRPGAPEQPNAIDDDCDGTIDEGTELRDDDGDGLSELDGDCDDGDAGVRPGADEVPDGRDDDCDGDIDEGTDAFDDDGDGFTEDGGDCDDGDDGVHPGAAEGANGSDDDCDGRIDEGTAAWDNDGDGLSAEGGDCDDDDPWNRPDGEEFCGDAADNDCDGEVDEGCEDDPPAPRTDRGCSMGGGGGGLLVGLLLLIGRRRRSLLVAGATLLLLGGCDSDVTITRSLGNLQVTPELIDLGAAAVGGEASLAVTLENVGTAALAVASVTLQGGDAAMFAVEGEASYDVPGGRSVSVTLRYRPTAVGLHTTTLTIGTDGGSSRLEITVRGRAGDPSLQVWPLLIDFGEDDGTRSVVLRNDATVPASLLGVELVGEGAAFTWNLPAAAGDPPAALAPGADLAIQIAFDPGDGSPADATLRLRTDDPLSPVFSVALLGNLACASALGLTVDEDGDGVSPCGGDCDDTRPGVWPGAPEYLDSRDNDCDGDIDEGTDAFDDDGDGFTELDGDCDDTDPATHPGGDEVLNGVDDDCDGAVDDGTPGLDDDGDGFSEDGGDCDDGDPAVRPGAPEQADGVDQDCDGVVDEGTALYDDDGDGFNELDGDCHDGDADVNPDADEEANGIDDDCDGAVDEGTAWGDDDGDGFTEAGGDCDDGDPAVNPAAEELPGVPGDEDCDGVAE